MTDGQALGVLAYEFTCGQEPFGADSSQGTRRESYNRFDLLINAVVQARICRCDVEYPAELSSEARALMQKVSMTTNRQVSVHIADSFSSSSWNLNSEQLQARFEMTLGLPNTANDFDSCLSPPFFPDLPRYYAPLLLDFDFAFILVFRPAYDIQCTVTIRSFIVAFFKLHMTPLASVDSGFGVFQLRNLRGRRMAPLTHTHDASSTHGHTHTHTHNQGTTTHNHTQTNISRTLSIP
jgi:hypothetical protein